MITPMTMHDSICNFLEKTADYALRTRDTSGKKRFITRKPHIIRSGWVLPKSINSDGSEIFPYILPRIDKLENIKNTRESVVTLDIIVGVYDPGVYDKDGNLVSDGTGYRDFWNLVEVIRQAFFATQTIDNRYRLLDDYFDAGMFSEQVYPYWEGSCKTKWHVMFPLPQTDFS